MEKVLQELIWVHFCVPKLLKWYQNTSGWALPAIHLYLEPATSC